MNDPMGDARAVRVYENLKRLKATPEWHVFAEHMKTVIAVHEFQAVEDLAADNLKSAQRQSWIVEGLREALEEPQNVVAQRDTFLAKTKTMIKEAAEKVVDTLDPMGLMRGRK